MTAAAYVLLQTMRCRLARTPLARKQVDSLRLMLLKVGAWITTSVRRVVIHTAENHTWKTEWLAVARTWGALAT